MADNKLLSNRQPPRLCTPSETLVFTTTLIECEYADGSTGSGTGFFYGFCRRGDLMVPTVVTNRHVVKGAVKGAIRLHREGPDGWPLIDKFERFEFADFEARWTPHPAGNVDLCFMPIGELLEQSNSLGRRLVFFPLDQSLLPTPQELATYAPLEEVLMIGYPNGIWDAKNNMPILRRGVTATSPSLDYQGQREFLIDAACFCGSSGSPVFLYSNAPHRAPDGRSLVMMSNTRVKLLGVLYAGPQYTVSGKIEIVFVPTRQEAVPLTQIPMNLGVVIQSSRLLEIEEMIARQLPPA